MLEDRKIYLISKLSGSGRFKGIKRWFYTLYINQMSEGDILRLYYKITDRGGRYDEEN